MLARDPELLRPAEQPAAEAVRGRYPHQGGRARETAGEQGLCFVFIGISHFLAAKRPPYINQVIYYSSKFITVVR